VKAVIRSAARLGAILVAALVLNASALAPARSAPAGARYAQIYRVRTLDAGSVGELLKRSFPDVTVDVDKSVNALIITASAARQRRIVAALAELDGAPNANAGAPAAYDLYTLRAALPGINGNPSTTATDLAATVTQALAPAAGDLHITVSATTPQLIITGNPASVALARELLAKLDVAQKLVVLDTQILEVDETVAKDLGLSFPQPVVASTFSEITPTDANGTAQRLIGLQPLGRTALSLTVQLGLLIRNGTARVLANPRITTVSGRTATIRAGDTIAVQTTAGGGAGTVATTQIQTFQTGVTLDITAIVNEGNDVSVSLHPSVNSETAIINGIPQIATRDTQTTVTLKEDQTLIIGGLIQESSGRTVNKIPLLGDLPLVGRAFRETQVNQTRNELIITVTPHVVVPGQSAPFAPRPAPPVPVPPALPTLPPGTRLGAARPTGAPLPGAVRAPAAAPSPSPAASAYPTLNTFTYGTIPQNNFAKSTDPVQIFYATLSPTVLGANKVVLVNTITSSNAQRVTLSYGTFTQQLAEVNRGQWQARFPLGPSVLPAAPANVSFTLTAARSDGSSTTIPIPVSVAP
jgi:Flp pilus assembly secretin CpaC